MSGGTSIPMGGVLPEFSGIITAALWHKFYFLHCGVGYSEIMDLYAENILDHYRHPRNKKPPLSSKECHGERQVTHEEVNVSCGDEIAIHMVIAAGRVTGVWWEGSGCAISQAAMSMLGEELAGKSLDEVESLKKEDVYDLLGVPIGPRRIKCALLGLHTLKNAVRKFKRENALGWAETAGDGCVT